MLSAAHRNSPEHKLKQITALCGSFRNRNANTEQNGSQNDRYQKTSSTLCRFGKNLTNVVVQWKPSRKDRCCPPNPEEEKTCNN